MDGHVSLGNARETPKKKGKKNTKNTRYETKRGEDSPKPIPIEKKRKSTHMALRAKLAKQ